ncbi:MAG: hypothetical protein LBC64_08080 [Fibromonadaceae bacterium]|jgi:uncharacterized coiled-coil protein SlyX|nr:hypothetical protein [Fibromonadaceae bacterium]
MDPNTLNNPVFNDQLAGQLISSGNVAIAVALVLLQIAIIPIAALVFRRWEATNKRIIDLEAENRKISRDKQAEAFDNRISQLEKDNDHKIDEISRTVESMNSTMTKLFEKIGELTTEMKDFAMRLVRLEK